MALKRESLLQIHRGTRILGRDRPLLVVTGDTTHEAVPLYEYYIFHNLEQLPFLYSRFYYGVADEMYPIDFESVPEMFSATALVNSAFQKARDTLDYDVYELNRDLHREVFWSGAGLDFHLVTDELPLKELKILGKFRKELDTMFNFSRSRAIRELGERLAGLAGASLKIEPRPSAKVKPKP